RVVAIADANHATVLEVDAFEAFDERRHEMAPRLLAVGDDVDAGMLLIEEREADGIALAFGERVAFELPRRPQRLGFREPRRLRQAPGNRRAQHLVHRVPRRLT